MTSAVHKGSKMGEAAFRAAGDRGIRSGLEFEYNGVKYRVVSPDLHGLRSYFSYEEVGPVPPIPEMPGFKLIYAGPLEDLLAKAKMPPSEGQQIPPYIRDILTAMRPDPEELEPKTGCPCGFCNGDPDFEEVPGAEATGAGAVSRLVAVNVVNSFDKTGHRISIHLHGTPAEFGPDGVAVVKAVAEHFGVDDASRRVAHLEKENNRLHGLYEHYRADAKQARARAEKLEGIIQGMLNAAQDGYRAAEIIPF